MKLRILMLLTIFCCVATCKEIESVAENPIFPIIAENSYTILIIPDTQNYIETEESRAIFRDLLTWVNQEALTINLKFILQTGDITNNNLPDEWVLMQQFFNTIDEIVPIVFAVGNHDYASNGNGNPRSRSTRINDYLNYSTLLHSKSIEVGKFKDGEIENVFIKSSTNPKMMILSLEWFTRDEVVFWADSIVSSNSDYKTIILTHAFLNSNGNFEDYRLSPGSDVVYGPYNQQRMTGLELWHNSLINHQNVFLTVNGHINGSMRKSSFGKFGNTVEHMAFNTQDLLNGGNGWIRLLEFRQDSSIYVHTFSPISKEISITETDSYVFKAN